jgi:hypothetical protein
MTFKIRMIVIFNDEADDENKFSTVFSGEIEFSWNLKGRQK